MATSALIQYGFTFGSAKVERVCSDDKKGWVYLSVTTPKLNQGIKIYVTKTGKLRVYRDGKEML